MFVRILVADELAVGDRLVMVGEKPHYMQYASPDYTPTLLLSPVITEIDRRFRSPFNEIEIRVLINGEWQSFVTGEHIPVYRQFP